MLLGERDSDRRYRRMSIEPSLLAAIFGQGTPASLEPDEPVPDLRIVGARLSSWHRSIELLVTSETFEPIHEGAIEPDWTPVYRRHEAVRE